MEKRRFPKLKLKNTQLIAVSFLAVILLGTLLLCLPFSSAAGKWTNPVDALFTATTATCVTGLVVQTTATYWSTFGHAVILVLIQIGGIGFMSLLTMISFFIKRQVSLHERRLIFQSTGALQMSGVMASFRQLLIGTFVIEGVGAALLARRFIPMFGMKKGIWYAVFHSISSFCNAGIDILGDNSLINYANDRLVTGTVMFLIVMGGLGFLVWNDLLRNLFHPGRINLHSKLVLSFTAILVVGGMAILFFTEYNASMKDMNFFDKLWNSLFQSVTTRTAGFVAVDQSTLSDSGSLVSMILMFIGGSPGSTAGGVKTTTMLVFLLCSWHLAHNRESITIFKRRIDNRIVRQAGAVICLYMAMVLVATVLICMLETDMGLREVLYETISAMATVGLSMNITSSFGVLSKLILVVLMYAGRLGGLSLFLAITESEEQAPMERPVEKILIG